MKTRNYSLGKVNFVLVDKEKMLVSSDSSYVILTLPEENLWSMHWEKDDKIQMPPKIFATCSELEYQEITMSEQSKGLLEQLKQSLAGNLKTSAEWQELFHQEILDADGWDRTHFNYSWRVELITREEFEKRAKRSTTKDKSKWSDL